MNSLNDIVFENINEQFAYGVYLGLKVIIMKENGYVNGSKLCKLSGKKFKHWLENDKTQELINYYMKKPAAGNPALGNNVIIYVKGGVDLDVRGTYICKELIPALCQWISVEFYDKVQNIINEYAVTEFKKELTEYKEALGEALSDVIKQNKKILEKSTQYVPPPENKKKNHVFYITRESNNKYKAHRIQKERFKYSDNIIVLFDTANAINFGVRLRECLGYKSNRFQLPEGITENQLIMICTEINNQKFN